MNRLKLVLTAACIAAPLVALATPLLAATTHNLQNGTNGSNANKPAMSDMQQDEMKPMMHKSMMNKAMMRQRMMHKKMM